MKKNCRGGGEARLERIFPPLIVQFTSKTLGTHGGISLVGSSSAWALQELRLLSSYQFKKWGSKDTKPGFWVETRASRSNKLRLRTFFSPAARKPIQIQRVCNKQSLLNYTCQCQETSTSEKCLHSNEYPLLPSMSFLFFSGAQMCIFGSGTLRCICLYLGAQGLTGTTENN